MGYPQHVMRGIRRILVVSDGAPLRMSELFGWCFPRLPAASLEHKHEEIISRDANKLGLRAVRLRDSKGRFTGAEWRLKTEADE